MATRKNVEYKAVLVFPGFGEERDNAEQIAEAALAYLNEHQQEPGLRFAPNVTARLEIVPDLEQAEAKLRTDDGVAMVVLHGLPDDERLAFTRACAGRGVSVCRTTPAPEPSGDTPPAARAGRRGWKVVFRRRAADDEPPAHTILDTTLTAPPEGDQEELSDRVGQLIGVLALGVMAYHWAKNPPRIDWPEEAPRDPDAG